MYTCITVLYNSHRSDHVVGEIGCDAWIFRCFCFSFKKSFIIYQFFMELFKGYWTFMSIYNSDNFFKVRSGAITNMKFEINVVELDINKGEFINKAVDDLHLFNHIFRILWYLLTLFLRSHDMTSRGFGVHGSKFVPSVFRCFADATKKIILVDRGPRMALMRSWPWRIDKE